MLFTARILCQGENENFFSKNQQKENKKILQKIKKVCNLFRNTDSQQKVRK